MGIHLTDLIVEATIRDGLEYLKQNPDVVDDIFSPLTRTYNQRKYGQAEIEKIKTMLNTKNIAVVHSFYEAESKSPCYSIQLGAEAEAKDRAHLGDFEADVQEDIEDEDSLIRIPLFTPLAHDPVSGKVSVPDNVDLSPLNAGYIFVDGDENESDVQRGISNVPGNKFFFIPKGVMPNITDPCFIKTFLSFTQHEEKGDTSSINILIGVHAKDALLTKYLYVILKYIMKSRKNDLIRRGIVNSSFQGSDFTRDLKYEGDMVFTRFFTLSGQVDDTWASADVPLIDNVEIDATPGDTFSTFDGDEDES